TIYGNVELRAQFVPADPKTPDKRNSTGNDRNQEDDDTDDNVWANKKTLYIRTKAGVTVRIYTLDGMLQRQFVTTDTGLTTRHLDRGIYIVTLDGSAGRKIVISE
ncbi:MAG: T9SS type A sorting domain-containing protein, partial [Tannerella sp.]|nr:T9SS type A sorting domain-containing protein [Tannerella sp.]